MDKNKLLNSLKAQRNAWNESLVNAMKLISKRVERTTNCGSAKE